MHLVYNPYMLLPLFAMLMAVFLWIRGWRYHSSRMGKTYLVLMGVLAWWSLSVVMEHWNQGLAPKIFWIKMSYFGIVCLPVAWLIFTAQYTGREKWLTVRNVSLLFIVPLITLIMVWTNSMFHLMWKDMWLDTSINPPVDAVTHNLWFWAHSAYSYSLLLIGTYFYWTCSENREGFTVSKPAFSYWQHWSHGSEIFSSCYRLNHSQS